MNSTTILQNDTTYENYEYYKNYDSTAISPDIHQTVPSCRDAMCVCLAIANVIIFLLGVTGNGLVIWIAGFKMKKSINTTWYLSLAVSDFLFCAFLPFNVVYLVKRDWVFGLFMCKFLSFILFLNMFSSIILLVIISVDRCVVVMLPVWAQNQRTVRKASVVVMLAWITSAVLSTPSAVFRDITEDHMMLIKKCFNNFKTTGNRDHTATAVRQLIFGFVIPFLIIVTCYVLIIRKLKTNQMAKSRKPFKIMTVLIVTFFICWLPFHIVALMELNHTYHSHNLSTGQKIVGTLASANSFLNPFLYAFMGKDFKRKFYSILSKIESAIEEEGQSTVRGTSITSSGEGKRSTTF